MADTAETAAVVCGPRMLALTSEPSSSVRCASGSRLTSIRLACTTSVTVSASVGSTPARSTATVAARYIAPVSR